jgi:hypothetical protein|tara:strand:- start:483 stop:932 length:450 start_codon:yes stop_codon:yes gene_type:complete
MNLIDDVLEMWESDSVIDQFKLDDTTIKLSKLHSKYLGLITKCKLTKKKLDMDYKTLLKDKWLYYNGKLSKEEIDLFGWDYDPFKGLNKPLKGDMNYYYDSDTDIQNAQAKLEYYKVYEDTLKEILDTIRWRHQSISNIIKWRSFEAGV